jgi:osmotically-inducible protein OsmY
VKKVYNELQVQQPASLLARSNDSLLTTKIKTQMLADSSVPSARVKVVTENGIVYMLGLVTREEANAATRVVQGVSGVQRVVRLFEYTN